ncbi:hypothetical protein PVL29_013132 [Vitis rotundifolia]|uniref:Uncharacterized protein n=1 Tax=Vitis rotundifolia TaxID=103349 RepID=A0AA38ZKP2_VITRO|nr:hypothetical protein PVL29_013132 [Vitis rotundifolia]
MALKAYRLTKLLEELPQHRIGYPQDALVISHHPRRPLRTRLHPTQLCHPPQQLLHFQNGTLHLPPRVVSEVVPHRRPHHPPQR